MSGFTVTVTTRTVDKAVRLLAGETVRLRPTLAATRREGTDGWADHLVEITGVEPPVFHGGTPILRCWVVTSGTPTHRVAVPVGDVASIELSEED